MNDVAPTSAFPTPNLKLDPSTLEIIETSRIKRFIGPLILKAHQQKAQKIAILSWDSEQATRLAAQIITVALTQQLDRKCAMMIPEGIRFHCESYDSLSIITLPEIETPNLSEQIDSLAKEIDRIYPFQILVGPAIKTWTPASSAKFRMALHSDAQILLMPHLGFPLGVLGSIADFTAKQKLNWLGVISMEKGA